jgi:Transposase DDE domain group 1
MTQGVLPFNYEAGESRSGMTALAGLPTYLELAAVAGLVASIGKHLGVRSGDQGWTDQQIVLSLVLLNLVGGDCVDDLAHLEKDGGIAEVMRRVETHGMPRHERRALLRRFRKERKRAVPSPSSVFRYLGAFHDETEEEKREPHKAFIPAPNTHLRGLARVNSDLVAFVQKHSPHKYATLDQDATLVKTHKTDALFCYKKFRAYQPLNTYWAEHDIMLHSEFRDGNVPAGFEQLRVLQDALAMLPESVEKAFLRSDSAGYQIELLKYCAEGRNERFGKIEFAISADVTAEFRKAALAADVEWKPLLRKRLHQKADGTIREEFEDIGQEYAEVAFVPNWIACGRKDAPGYRFLAVREPLRQLELLPIQEQSELPFQTVEFRCGERYKLFSVVTNRLQMPGDDLIRWHRERCGNSEKAHAIMKDDLAGGKLPSADFGVNAAWWAVMILSMNLHVAMKRLVLGGQWAARRMKAVRLHLIALPGQVIHHARQLIVRLGSGHPSNALLFRIRQGILALAAMPSG